MTIKSSKDQIAKSLSCIEQSLVKLIVLKERGGDHEKNEVLDRGVETTVAVLELFHRAIEQCELHIEQLTHQGHQRSFVSSSSLESAAATLAELVAVKATIRKEITTSLNALGEFMVGREELNPSGQLALQAMKSTQDVLKELESHCEQVHALACNELAN